MNFIYSINAIYVLLVAMLLYFGLASQSIALSIMLVVAVYLHYRDSKEGEKA